MKLNWGHGVAIVLGCFIIFILSLLYFSGDTGAMVTDNYYEKELNFQEEINSQNRANALKEKPQIIFQANGLLLKFPESTSSDFSGNVYFLRNEDETKDIKETIKLDSKKNFLISSVKLKAGVYELTINWKENNKNYLIKKSIKWIPQ